MSDDSRSVSGLLRHLSEQPRRVLSLLILVAGLLALISVFAAGFIFFLQWRRVLPEEAKVAGFEVHFASKSTDEKRTYFFVVNPQGWQETPVRLNKGDEV